MANVVMRPDVRGGASRDALDRTSQHAKPRNRRKRYLEVNPQYFGPGLESQDPVLFDRLVRSWFTGAERARERQEKGFGGILEADLMRSEARLGGITQHQQEHSTPSMTASEVEADNLSDDESSADPNAPRRSRESDFQKWRAIMERHFIAGNDSDFDYSAVDGNDMYDDSAEAEMDRQDSYFDEEQPQQMSAGRLQMETGEQDF